MEIKKCKNSNRRSEHRIDINLDVLCYPYVNIIDNSPICYKTSSINLSVTGICIKSTDDMLVNLKLDSFVIVEFKFNKENVCILCKCKNINNVKNKLGLQFIRVIYNSTKNISPTNFIFNKLSKFIASYQLKNKYIKIIKKIKRSCLQTKKKGKK